jgi:hypothetical protein
MDIEQEFADGYRDGRDRLCPVPTGNRHPAYVHSFLVGRAEIDKRPIPVAVSRVRVAEIEAAQDSGRSRL